MRRQTREGWARLGGYFDGYVWIDALHLASALLWRERRAAELLFATHDPRQARAARALGFDCVGV